LFETHLPGNMFDTKPLLIGIVVSFEIRPSGVVLSFKANLSGVAFAANFPIVEVVPSLETHPAGIVLPQMAHPIGVAPPFGPCWFGDVSLPRAHLSRLLLS
jgi:hypothetical protein